MRGEPLIGQCIHGMALDTCSVCEEREQSLITCCEHGQHPDYCLACANERYQRTREKRLKKRLSKWSTQCEHVVKQHFQTRDEETMTFRKAFMQAVRESDLGRLDKLRLHFIGAIPPLCRRLESVCEELVIAEGLAAPGEINWDQLAEFLKEILPVILEFIQALIVLFP